MLQHLRPVKVVLTPHHLRVLFCDRFLHLVLLLLLRENLHPSIRFRNRGWELADKVVCFLWAYGAAAQTTGFGFRTAPGFGSSAARLFPVGSADWRSRSSAKGDDHGCPNPPGFFLPSDQVTAARVLATPRRERFPRDENQVGNRISISRKCRLRRARSASRSNFIFGYPIPL